MMSGSKGILPLTDAIRTTTLFCNSRRAKNIRIPLIFNENRCMLMFWRSSGKIVPSCKHEHNLYLLTLTSYYYTVS